MRTFPKIGLVLAAAIALAGCQASAVGQVSLQNGTKPGATTPATVAGAQTGAIVQTGGTKPGVTTGGTATGGTKAPVAVGKVPAAMAQASVAAGQETASALAEEREMDDYETLTDLEGGSASYQLFQLGDVLDAAEKARQAGMKAGDAGMKAGDAGMKAGDAGMKAGEAGMKAGEAGMKAGEAGMKAGEAGMKAGQAAVRAGIVLRGELKANEKAKLEKLKEKSVELRKQAVKLEIKVDAFKKVLERQSKRAEKLNMRLEKMQDARLAIRGKIKDAAWVDNGDGTASRTIEIDVKKAQNDKSFERKAKIVRTRRIEDKVLLLATAEFTQALPGGLTRTSTRSKTLNADGTYTIAFDSLITLPNGATRTAAWDKTIGVDGGCTGTGTLTWTDKDGKVIKTATIKLSGNEDEPIAKCEDPTTGGEAEVEVKADGTIDATIGDDAGATAEVAIDTSADGSVEVSEGENSVSVGADGTIVVESGDNVVSTDGSSVVASNEAGTVKVDGDAAATGAASADDKDDADDAADDKDDDAADK